MLRALPMLRPTRWFGPLALSSLVASGCPTTHVRCQPPYEAVAGADPLRCELRDGGADAPDAPDAPPPACVPDAGPTSASDPAGNGVDENCDGVDGVLTGVIFVSEGGADEAAAGTTPDAPVRSLPFALRRARETSRATILMQAGSYDSATSSGGAVPTLVAVDRTVTIAGRYVPVGGRPQWVTRDASAAGRTAVTAPNAGVAVLARDVRLIGLEVVGKPSMLGDGNSVYGLFAVNAPGLEVRDTTITAETAAQGNGGRAGMVGSDGAPGQDARTRGLGGLGGNACGTTNGGGEGGNAGVLDPVTSPTPGQGGQTFAMRTTGMGGPAGSNAAAGGTGGAGTDGADGRAGDPSGLGFWTRDGFQPGEGRSGEPGMPGTGGGGGGGGFTSATRAGGGGGGGGGGGCGGTPGSGGQGGGGSFGVYLYGAATTATFVNCSIAAGPGGRGGDGGAAGGRPAGDGGALSGAAGGRGGMGSAGTGGPAVGAPETVGGPGGAGGRGGIGGAGGPGIGGPSVGIVRVAGAMSTLDAMTLGRVSFGAVGANGTGRIDTPPQQLAMPDFSPRDTTPDAGGARTDASAD
jgi:hypothetical protein